MVILTVLALVFRSGHEEFVGGKEDPTDGVAVSNTIFISVLIYAVRLSSRSTRRDPVACALGTVALIANGCHTGFLCILRTSGSPARTREPQRRDRLVIYQPFECTLRAKQLPLEFGFPTMSV
jgi:hypothetical protein